jgi:hypothetical protein
MGPEKAPEPTRAASGSESELDRIKSLDSDAYSGRQELWAICDKTADDHLRAKEDPEGRLRHLYPKREQRL